MARFLCAIVALLVARFARRPVATFVAIAVAATAASLFIPLAASATPTETKLLLALGHLLAAAIMIPVIGRHLAVTQERQASL